MTLLYCRRGVKSCGKPYQSQTYPYDLVIGLDRSDRKPDLYLINTRTHERQKLTLNTSPESLHTWLAQLRQQHAPERLAICLEQPAVMSMATRLMATLAADREESSKHVVSGNQARNPAA